MIALPDNAQAKEDIHRFIDRLPFLKIGEVNFLYYGMLPLSGVGTAIAFDRFLILQEKVVFGATALTNAYKQEHWDLWNDNLNNNNALFYRKMYFEQAVEAYNKIPDYIYLILYFNFELYNKLDGKEIQTREDVVRLSKTLVHQKKKGAIDQWLLGEKNTRHFGELFTAYRESNANLRNLANDLKHRGCQVVGRTVLPRIGQSVKVVDGREINLSALIEPVVLDLEQEIENLVLIHNSIVDLQKELYSICDFKNQASKLLE